MARKANYAAHNGLWVDNDGNSIVVQWYDGMQSYYFIINGKQELQGSMTPRQFTMTRKAAKWRRA